MLGREIMDENIKKVVEDSKRLLLQEKSATETPGSSQRPTLPPFRSDHANMTLEAPHHKTVENSGISQRQLLVASNSGSSVSTWRYSYSQAPREQTQVRQAATDSRSPRPDYYSMPEKTFSWCKGL